MSTDVETAKAGMENQSAEQSGEATEHRGVSVLFADLVGSTESVEELGAEGYAELVRRFHAICNEVVRSRGGVVAQYQGDGIICYFGFPKATENDASHAVEAGLEIRNALAEVPGDIAMETRVGISSGTVMLRGDGVDFGANAVGSCINRAARLEALAATGEIYICSDTQALVGDLFHIRDIGEHALKGFREKQAVYKVERFRSGVATRFEALRGRKTGALVGRNKELQTLNGHFEAAANGNGKSVVLSAGPGFGKSRLVNAFLDQPELKGAARFVLQCAPEHRGTPLYPVSRYLEWVAGTGFSDSDEVRHGKLKRLFSAVWSAGETQLDDLLDLLSPMGSENPIDETESVPLRRGRALTLLADKILASVAGRDAMIVVFEDVHWIDPSSAMLLEILVDKALGHSALVLLSTRPQPPFGDGLEGADDLIRLEGLSDENSRELARQALGTANLTDEQVNVIIEKSDGVPLFLEEYADMLSQSSPGSEWNIPLTLAGLVQTKLDRLDKPARELARVGSALGRNFTPAFAAEIAGLDQASVQDLTGSLVQQKLALRTHATSAGGEGLMFGHALIRDAIYGSMLSKDRRDLHDGIASALLSPTLRSPVADHVLAHHLAHADRHAEAVERYIMAALGAAGQGAAFEALGHLEAGGVSVDALPEGEERDRMELQICAIRGPTQMVTRGPGNPDFGSTQDRAMALVNKLGLHETMVPVIYNTALHAWATAKLDRAMTIAGSIALINDEDPTDAAYMAANTMRGLIAWHQGHNDMAIEALKNTVARHDPEIHQDMYAVFLKEFGVFSLFYLGLTQAVRGEYDEARKFAERSSALGQQMGFPHAKGFGFLARFNT
ncbi:MAG: ATP-binding protein, partial [Boseongicola sp.]